MKKKITLILALCVGAFILVYHFNTSSTKANTEALNTKRTKKTLAEKATATKERWLHDFNLQKDPVTGTIPKEELLKEFEHALLEKQSPYAARQANNNYTLRGPTNLGGRTRALQIDKSDATGNTMLAGGVSSGVFRTTDGGQNWSKVSAFDEIHNVTTIAQDPRPGFQNIWYYGTGEFSGNSARFKGTNFYGYGIWKSTDSGLTWQQLATTKTGDFEILDNFFDFVIDIEVHPTTGDLFVGTAGKIYRLSGTNTPIIELERGANNLGWTDLEITSTGRVYAAIDGNDATVGGVWTSATGTGGWTRISENFALTNFNPQGRIALALAPSNENILYVLYNNGQNNTASNRVVEADLFKYNATTDTWTNYTSKLPDESGGSDGNDPFSIQGGYDLVVSVKPDNENFVVIGGTNLYKINDITTDATFRRIGGYSSANSYGLYSGFNDVSHHPDQHAVAWGLTDPNIMYSGSDGGVHKNPNAASIAPNWENLNNNYITYQYYHVNLLNEANSDVVIGGAQDNGTTIGGTGFGNANTTSMTSYFGGDGAAVAITRATGSTTDFVTYVTTQNGRMLRGNNNFPTTNITPTDSNGDAYDSEFVTYFHMDPDNPSTIYYAADDELLRTNNAETVTGSAWENVGKLQFAEKISSMATTRGTYNSSSSYLFLGGQSGNVYRVADPQNGASVSFTKITPAGANPNAFIANSGPYVSDIAVHPTDTDKVIVVYSNYGSSVKNIFITNNATAATPTWVEVERNLDAHSIRSAAIAVVGTETHYFVGTARGLYKSTDPTTQDWSLEGGSVMGIPIVNGLVYRPSDNMMLVGTHGNGMFETNLNGTLSLEQNSKESVQIAVYPNPTQDILKFASRDFNFNTPTQFSVYTITGKQVQKGLLKDKAINVSELSRGMYLVKLKQNNNTITKKFVKN